MIQYSSIADAWGINNKQNIKEPVLKEIPDNITTKKNNETESSTLSSDITTNKPNNDCEIFEHLFKCTKCMDKLKKLLLIKNNENFNKNKYVNNKENFSIIDFIKNNYNNIINDNKQVIQLILILLLFIFIILLVQSFRKQIPINDTMNKFYIYPQEINKLRKILDTF